MGTSYRGPLPIVVLLTTTLLCVFFSEDSCAVSAFSVLSSSSQRYAHHRGAAAAAPSVDVGLVRVLRSTTPQLPPRLVVHSRSRPLTHLGLSSSDSTGDGGGAAVTSTDPVIRQTSKALKRASWFSWWSQVILTTISSVILVFARSVMTPALDRTAGPSFLLSGAGLLLSAVSIVWTWGNGTRLSRRLTAKPTTRTAAAHMLRRAIRVGVTVNLLGLFCSLVAAQEIVGSLAIKVMTSNRSIFASGGASLLAPEGLQPLDVLVVQANTNSLLSQFCSLCALLYLTKNVQQLDPPSTDEKPRKG